MYSIARPGTVSKWMYRRHTCLKIIILKRNGTFQSIGYISRWRYQFIECKRRRASWRRRPTSSLRGSHSFANAVAAGGCWPDQQQLPHVPIPSFVRSHYHIEYFCCIFFCGTATCCRCCGRDYHTGGEITRVALSRTGSTPSRQVRTGNKKECMNGRLARRVCSLHALAGNQTRTE